LRPPCDRSPLSFGFLGDLSPDDSDLLSPDLNRDLTRRFRLGFALLRGGSRIKPGHHDHRAGVLSLEGPGCPLEHSVLPAWPA
jgi:hypothetical protein